MNKLLVAARRFGKTRLLQEMLYEEFVSKLDKIKTAHLDRQAYEWRADKMPSKKTKRAKVKERQAAKKLIRIEK